MCHSEGSWRCIAVGGTPRSSAEGVENRRSGLRSRVGWPGPSLGMQKLNVSPELRGDRLAGLGDLESALHTGRLKARVGSGGRIMQGVRPDLTDAWLAGRAEALPHATASPAPGVLCWS